VVVLDLVLTWIGSQVGWLRQLVRVLSVGTVAANAVAGWPDPVAVGLHAAAPVMLLAMIEADQTVLMRRIGQAEVSRHDALAGRETALTGIIAGGLGPGAGLAVMGTAWAGKGWGQGFT
jgi:hypothetical protein